jgi:hypothetical protein
MPNSIADLIFSQMQTAGKPRTTTQQTTGTQTLKQQSPLDVGSLGLLLYLMLSGGKKNALGSTLPEGLQPQGPMGGYTPVTSAGQQNPLALIMSLLGGMGGMAGLGGSNRLF